MDRRQVDLREVRAASSACTSSGPRTPSSSIADKAAKAGVVAQVMDEVRLGGIKDVALGATAPVEN